MHMSPLPAWGSSQKTKNKTNRHDPEEEEAPWYLHTGIPTPTSTHRRLVLSGRRVTPKKEREREGPFTAEGKQKQRILNRNPTCSFKKEEPAFRFYGA